MGGNGGGREKDAIDGEVHERDWEKERKRRRKGEQGSRCATGSKGGRRENNE